MDAQQLLHLAENGARPLDVAGGAQTDGDVVLPLGRQVKHGVEGGHPVDLLQGVSGGVGDHGLHLDGQIAVDLLRLLHDGHQGAGLILQLHDGFLQPFRLLRGPGERDRLLHAQMNPSFDHLGRSGRGVGCRQL